MGLSQRKSPLLTLRVLLLGLSVVSLVLCTLGATAHYLKWAWGNLWQLVGWLLSMLFLLLAFSPPPREIAAGLKSVSRSKTAFFIFWILVFTVSHLWNFRIAPWNGNGVFIDSAVDLWFLKDYVIGHPFQAAWFYFYLPPIAHETLFQHGSTFNNRLSDTIDCSQPLPKFMRRLPAISSSQAPPNFHVGLRLTREHCGDSRLR